MKKVSLLILVVILASTALMAATPTKLVRLTIINKSGYDVFMKLTGNITEQFYYLTIPMGDADYPMVKVFTVMVDVYDRETWTCNGTRSAGAGDILYVDSNIRLVFTPCGRRTLLYAPELSAYWSMVLGTPVDIYKRNVGEPRMEKVTAFGYVQSGFANWVDAYLYSGYIALGCFTYYYRVRTWRTPVGCAWRYQY
jgi:hypothetical protein